MFAVIKTGGKQYKVAADDVLEIEKLEVEAGATITFEEVLMVGGESGVTVGTPVVNGAHRDGRGRRADPRPEGDLLQEAPPARTRSASASSAAPHRG